MAAFLQRTLCRLSGRVTGKPTAGATVPVKSRGVLGTTRHGEGGRGDTEIENTGQWTESRRPQAAAGRGRNEFTDVTQVTRRPSSITGHAA